MFLNDEMIMLKVESDISILGIRSKMIFCCDTEEDDEEEVGYAKYSVHNADWEEYDFLESVDYSQESYDAFSSFEHERLECDEYGKKKEIYGTVFLIERMEINVEYRDKGIGSKMLEKMIKYFERMGADFVILKPFPLEYEGEVEGREEKFRKDKERLVEFYRKNGFKTTTEYIEDENLHMYREFIK